MVRKRTLIISKRTRWGMISLALLLGAGIALGFANKRLSQSVPADKPNVPVKPALPDDAARQLEQESTPASSAQLNLSSSLIAGGGGRIAAGNFSGFVTVGQALAANPVVFGNFSQGAGFGYIVSAGPLGSPSPSPSPSPPASPTPTPPPSNLFVSN